MLNRLEWPNNARCAVMLSFDLDGETLFTAGPPGAGWRYPRSVSYGRYGPNRGVGRILDLLAAYDLESTFFIPGKIAKVYPELIREIDGAGHEIGCHGYDHELFSDSTLDQQRQILLRAREVIQEQTGKAFLGFRTPSGDPSPETTLLLQTLGFCYSSSMRGDDRPYRASSDDGPSDFIEIPAKWELDDYPQFSYDFSPAMPVSLDRIKDYRTVLENWQREFDGYYRYGLCFVLMLHPQIIGTPGRVLLLDELLQYIRSFPDVWFATGRQIAAWWRQKY